MRVKELREALAAFEDARVVVLALDGIEADSFSVEDGGTGYVVLEAD